MIVVACQCGADIGQNDLAGATNVLGRAESARIACRVSGDLVPPATGTTRMRLACAWTFQGSNNWKKAKLRCGPCARGLFL